ncbi:TPA: S8 family peptidase [Bacillus thuringiensis]|nr:S8 family peptidase [Bacillus thuringiensis]
MKLPDESKHKVSAMMVEQLEDLRDEEQIINVFLKKDSEISTASLNTQLEEVGAKVIDRFDTINTDVIQVKASQLKEILKNPAVKSVAMEQTYHLVLDVANKIVTNPINPDIETSLSGKGVTIAIIDTGIYPHPDLTMPNNRIIGFYDVFKEKEVEPFDDGGHGTHCAGCAAGNGHSSGGKYRGMAYQANLVGVRVFEGPTTPTRRIIQGIDWCIKNKEKYDIKVMSLSLGGIALNPPEIDPLCTILREAQNHGITVLAAAGNEGPFSQSIGSPGTDPEVITVGATNDKNTVGSADDAISNFSSRGPTKFGHQKPDVVAPGTNIISLRSVNSEYDRSYPEKRVGEDYCTMNGTSMATPIVAGLAALLYEAKPDATPEEIRDAILKGAKDLFHDADSAGRGYTSLKGSLEHL